MNLLESEQSKEEQMEGYQIFYTIIILNLFLIKEQRLNLKSKDTGLYLFQMI